VAPPPVLGTYPPGYGPPPGQPPAAGYAIAPLPGPPALPGIATDPVIGHALAPWWKRLVAILIDAAVIAMAYFLVAVAIAALVRRGSAVPGQPPPSGAEQAVGFLFVWLLGTIPQAVYFGIMNGSARGQTLGKMALGIAVRDARNGGPIGFWRAVVRAVVAQLFALLFLIPSILDNLTPLWDRRHQAWHDRAVRSVVVDLQL